jgi:Mycobacterium membrane protein
MHQKTQHIYSAAWFAQSHWSAYRRAGRSWRGKAMAFAGALRRVCYRWLYWRRSVSRDSPCHGSALTSTRRSNCPRHRSGGHYAVKFEVRGPRGLRSGRTSAILSVNADPQRVDAARSRWSKALTASVPAVMGNVVAQGDSNSIGCPIVIDGQVEAERISNEVNAFTYCRVTA